MDKINVHNLFPSAKLNNAPLDVKNLYNPKENMKTQKTNLNIERLVSLREERKNRTVEQYDKIFHRCINKVHAANNLGKLNVIYTVPEAIYMHPDYNPYECLDRLNSKLEDNNFETILLIDQISIFISWLNIDKKKK